MKKFFKTAFAALGAAALFFAGCSSESGGGGSSSSYPQITKVNISEKSRASDSHSVVLVASSEGASLEGAEITYKFEVVPENAASVTLTEENSAEGTVLVENMTSEEQKVTVKVTATLGEKTIEGKIELTLAAKSDESSSGNEGGNTGSGNEGDNTGSGNEGGNTGSGNEGGNSGSGNEGGNTGSGSEPETPAVEEKGSVKITVTVDGSISCKQCGKVYNFKVQAENCEHYKCADCGTSYYTQDKLDACEHSVIHFVDSADESANCTVTIKKGTKITLPEWTKEGSEICWTSEPADIDPASPIDAAEVTFTASWTSTFNCEFCGKVYYTSEEAQACTHYTCANEACDKHTDGYATQAEADNCNLKDGCPAYKVSCSFCGKEYSRDAEKEACTHYTCANETCDKHTDGYATQAEADNCNLKDGCPAYKVTCSQCGKEYSHDADAAACEHYKCPSCGTSYNSQAELDACKTQEGCEAWRTTCTNCETEYKTQAEADNCSVKPGCKGFVAVAVGTYNLSTTKTNGTVLFSKQSAGASQTASGITVTCTIDSKGANLKTNAGEVSFAIGSAMTFTFTDTNLKGVIISTSDGYIGAEGTTISEKLGADGLETTVVLGAGTYTVVGATSSSAKIATVTFAEIEE